MAIYPQEADPTNRVAKASLEVVIFFAAGVNSIQSYQPTLAEELVGGEPGA